MNKENIAFASILGFVGLALIFGLFVYLQPADPGVRSKETLQPIPTIIPYSECIEWYRVDSSYIGKEICVKGIIQAFGQQGTAVSFSADPNVFYVVLNGYKLHKGDCIRVDGKVQMDNNQALYIHGIFLRLCP